MSNWNFIFIKIIDEAFPRFVEYDLILNVYEKKLYSNSPMEWAFRPSNYFVFSAMVLKPVPLNFGRVFAFELIDLLIGLHFH